MNPDTGNNTMGRRQQPTDNNNLPKNDNKTSNLPKPTISVHEPQIDNTLKNMETEKKLETDPQDFKNNLTTNDLHDDKKIGDNEKTIDTEKRNKLENNLNVQESPEYTKNLKPGNQKVYGKDETTNQEHQNQIQRENTGGNDEKEVEFNTVMSVDDIELQRWLSIINQLSQITLTFLLIYYLSTW